MVQDSTHGRVLIRASKGVYPHNWTAKEKKTWEKQEDQEAFQQKGVHIRKYVTDPENWEEFFLVLCREENEID